MSLQRVYFCPITLKYIERNKDGSPTGRTSTCPKGYPSDGASGAIDIYSYSWFHHDYVCDKGTWDDGSEMLPKAASVLIGWYLKREDRSRRSRWWNKFTFWFGPRKLGIKGECPAFPELAGQVQLITGGRDSFYRKDYCGCGGM